jgi:uncharacterized lipoprotein YajG
MTQQTEIKLKALTKTMLVSCSLLLLAGCQTKQSVNTNASQSTSDVIAAPTAKSGDTTMNGKVVQSGTSYSLVDSNGKQTEIDSYKIDLSQYSNKQVSITGQFSGDTLFAAKVEETK